MNIDKIKGGLGFHILKFKNVEPIVFPTPTKYTFEQETKRSAWKTYRAEVWDLTEDIKHLIVGVEKRGFKDHHIDHITSIWSGFKMGIPAEMIADISNLRMLPYLENMKKGIR